MRRPTWMLFLIMAFIVFSTQILAKFVVGTCGLDIGNTMKHMASSWDPQVVRSFSGTSVVVKTSDPDCAFLSARFRRWPVTSSTHGAPWCLTRLRCSRRSWPHAASQAMPEAGCHVCLGLHCVTLYIALVFLVMKAQYFQVNAHQSQLYLVLLLPLWGIFCCMDSVGLGHPESYALWSCEKTQKNRMFKFQTFRVVVPHIFLCFLSLF